MPRDGSGTYSLPAGSKAVSGNEISSSKYNGVLNDIERDMNVPRPVSAGGTGVTSTSDLVDGIFPETSARIYQSDEMDLCRRGYSPIDFNASIDPAVRSQRFDLTKQGTGSNNVIQSVCEVPARNAVYSLHVTGSPDERSVINKFALDGPRAQTSVRWTKQFSDSIGHQSLALEHSATGLRFWSSANDSITEAENKIVRFQISDDDADAENLLISDVEVYTVWPGAGGEGSASPSISPDGGILVVERKVSDTENKVRVFNLRDLVEGGPGDYSEQHLIEFTIRTESVGVGYPLQGLTTDGQYVYVLTGDGTPTATKRMAKYTLSGELVGYTAAFGVGLDEALGDGTGSHYEPEGIYITRQGGRDMLAVCIASGDPGARTNRVFYLNADHMVSGRGFGELPSFYSTGANDFGCPDNEVLRLGGVERTTDPDRPTFEERAAFGPRGANSFGPRNSGTWTAVLADSETAGNISSTTAVGSFERVGNMMWVDCIITNISVSGMTGVNNLYIRGAALSPAAGDSNFTLVPAISTPINVVVSNVRFDALATQIGATVEESGNIVIREFRDDDTNILANISQFNGARMRISGWFRAAN